MDFRKIEQKWQKKWEKEKVFEPKIKKQKKFFFTTPYPYISGSLHIGQGRAVAESDIFCRYKRMKGLNVLYPLAFHITGTPVLGISAAIEQGDKKKIELYKNYVKNYIKDKTEISKTIQSFKDPWNIVKFFIPKMKQEYSALGLGVDWTRRFTTGDKDYQKFITWQFHKYKEKNYLIKGAYPVLYCPRCKNAVGEDDIQDADIDSVEKQEFALLKFPLENSNLILVAATLRPETAYGQTNLWINPETEYLKVKTDNEIWVMSREAEEKLAYQKQNIEVIGKIKPEKLIGKYATAPGLNKKIIILPSEFASATYGTGIVTSVGSDAPYDYIALKELQEKGCKGIDKEEIKKIKHISIIKTQGYGNFPAQEICKKMNITSLAQEEKLKQATKEIYKAGFHTGILKDNCGKYAGMKASEAKDAVKKDFIKQNKADVFYETTRKAFCRCGTEVIVSVMENQWFLDFNAKGWKEKSCRCLEKMEIQPVQARKQFQDTFEWLDKRPAARKRGIGTPLPFDKNWIIESLSDSTIYMTFYTIKNLINEFKIKPSQLTLELFDYILLGKGDIKKVAKQTKIMPARIKKLKESFEYWYPNDHRHTFVAHLSNHLSFFIFAHSGIYKEKYWPKKISLHGFVLSEGTKMSKSKGNVISLLDITNKYSADIFRAYITTATTVEGTFDWKTHDATMMQNNLANLYEISLEMIKNRKKSTLSLFGKAFMSRFEGYVKQATEALEQMKLRDYSTIAVYTILRALTKLKTKVSKKELNAVYDLICERWIKLISPVIPHISEELWSKLGKKTFVSLESWPKYGKSDKKLEQRDELIENLVSDLRNILKLVKIKPTKASIYSIPSEKQILKQASDYLEKEFGLKFNIFAVNDKNIKDPENKRKKAKPGKQGIYLE